MDSFDLGQDLPDGPTRPELDVLLRAVLGPAAEFRPGQREAIEAVLSEGARVVVNQATGWGKSLVYWISTRVRRDQGHGPTLIISPLISLMRDQLQMASRIGLRPAVLMATNRQEWEDVRERLLADEIDVLMISPERLANATFIRDFLPAIQGSIGLFVVDEVHCISDWGHDFRPDYRRIASILDSLPPSVPVLGTTATANGRVADDVALQFGTNVTMITGPLARRSLQLATLQLSDQAARLAWLARYVPKLPGSGIIYCLTVADTERVATWLTANGVDVLAYHARQDDEARARSEEALRRGGVKAVVATVALGMGFDKPDLAFVIHYQRPGSIIAYYQQVGRAGRALDDAYGILLSGKEDDDIQKFFIEAAFPPEEEMRAVLIELEAVDAASIGELQSRVNLRHRRMEAILKLLEIDGAVARDGSKYFRTLTPWQVDAKRIADVTARRWAELQQMQDYMTHPGCLMEFLTQALDDPSARPCGRCARCRGAFKWTKVDPELGRRAVAFLRGAYRTIKPRLRWPPSADPGFGGPIQPPNEAGYALAIYGDAGWGREVKSGKWETGRFSDELVVAAVDLVRERWRPKRDDGWWVAAVPSHRRTLVHEAASRMAASLGLPYRDDVLSIRNGARQQKEMENSVMQARNVREALALFSAPLPGPVILVDDIVDSGWTLTVAGHLLREAGSGPVYPFAFAEASAGDDS